MYTKHDRLSALTKRHRRVRRRISGTAERPRLCVSRSLHHIRAQIIDDVTGTTLAAASTQDAEVKKALKKSTSSVDAAAAVGKTIAQKGKKAGVTTVVFDRGGYQYHGRVKALAEAARSEGWIF
jgi:large subunit ribosomal protein L18